MPLADTITELNVQMKFIPRINTEAHSPYYIIHKFIQQLLLHLLMAHILDDAVLHLL